MNNIIAHRGVFNNKDIPENSMLAFKKALKLNIPIELDVQLTKDNYLVVFHDSDLFRMTGVHGIVQDMEYKDIKKLRLLDTKETIPLFSDVLKLVNNKLLLDIEIKTTKRITDTCSSVMELLNNYNNYDLKSFDPRIVRYLKKNYSSSVVGLLIDYHYPNKINNYLFKSNFIFLYTKADFVAISKKLLKKKRFRNMYKKRTTMIWTIQNKKEIKSDFYIYICNNLPY